MTRDHMQPVRPSSQPPSSTLLARVPFLPGIILTLLLLTGITAAAVTAQVPTAVELLYFRGESGDNVAHLEWETATEQDTAGFRLERARTAAGPYNTIEGYEFIVATGSVANGALYEATDETVVSGQTYWYKLVEISNANVAGEEWTLSLDIEQAEPTGEVIGNVGSSPEATNTLAPTSTTEATATAATSSAASSAATSTPRPSGAGSGNNRATDTPAPTVTPEPTNTSRPATTSIRAIATPTAFAFPTSAAGVERDTVAPTASPTTDAYPVVDEDGSPTTAATPVIAAETGAVAEAAGVETEAGPATAATDAEELGSLGRRSVGSGAETEVMPEETTAVQEEGESSRLLLWLGFIAAFFIFVGGVAFSIFLSTRKRSDEPS